ncbi:MAG: hypothetical protein FWG35_00630 [Spirochaetaceae bacterium]|nr:hypothetical protein [Spirochaetaceae bacterium]
MIYSKRKNFGVLCRVVLSVLIFAGCVSAPVERDDAREVTEEEKAFLSRYLETLTVKVSFREDSAEDSLYREAVTGFARKILAREGFLAEDGGDAEAAIEIDAVSEGESRRENHYGTAFVRCCLVEPFTGARRELPGITAPRTFSKASPFDAAVNATEAALVRMLPEAVAETRAFLVELYGKGIVYGLVARNMGSGAAGFRKAFAGKVRGLTIEEETPERTRYGFAFFGTPEDAEAAAKDAAAEAGITGFAIQERKGKLLNCNGGN